jgi:hypothetical protein
MFDANFGRDRTNRFPSASQHTLYRAAAETDVPPGLSLDIQTVYVRASERIASRSDRRHRSRVSSVRSGFGRGGVGGAANATTPRAFLHSLRTFATRPGHCTFGSVVLLRPTSGEIEGARPDNAPPRRVRALVAPRVSLGPD